MRQVDHGLNCAAEDKAARLVQQQRQDDRPYLIGDDLRYRDDQSIAENPAELRQGKQKFKILPADPGRSREAFCRAKILKGDDHAIHRIVAKQQNEDHPPARSSRKAAKRVSCTV